MATETPTWVTGANWGRGLVVHLVVLRMLLSRIPSGFFDGSYHTKLFELHGLPAVLARIVFSELAFLVCLFLLLPRPPAAPPSTPLLTTAACTPEPTASPPHATEKQNIAPAPCQGSQEKAAICKATPEKCPCSLEKSIDAKTTFKASHEKQIQRVASKYTVVCLNKLKQLKSLVNASDDSNGEWEMIVDRGDDVRVWKSRTQAHRYRLSGIFKTTAATAFDTLNDVENRNKWDEMTESGRVVKSIEARLRVQYVKLRAVWPTSARDLLVLSHWTREAAASEKGLCYMAVGWAIEPDEYADLANLVPTPDGVVRMGAGCLGAFCEPLTEWREDGQEQQARITQIADGDPRGWIPQSLIALIATKKMPNSFVRLAKFAASLKASNESRFFRENNSENCDANTCSSNSPETCDAETVPNAKESESETEKSNEESKFASQSHKVQGSSSKLATEANRQITGASQTPLNSAVQRQGSQITRVGESWKQSITNITGKQAEGKSHSKVLITTMVVTCMAAAFFVGRMSGIGRRR